MKSNPKLLRSKRNRNKETKDIIKLIALIIPTLHEYFIIDYHSNSVTFEEARNERICYETENTPAEYCKEILLGTVAAINSSSILDVTKIPLSKFSTLSEVEAIRKFIGLENIWFGTDESQISTAVNINLYLNKCRDEANLNYFATDMLDYTPNLDRLIEKTPAEYCKKILVSTDAAINSNNILDVNYPPLSKYTTLSEIEAINKFIGLENIWIGTNESQLSTAVNINLPLNNCRDDAILNYSATDVVDYTLNLGRLIENTPAEYCKKILVSTDAAINSNNILDVNYPPLSKYTTLSEIEAINKFIGLENIWIGTNESQLSTAVNRNLPLNKCRDEANLNYSGTDLLDYNPNLNILTLRLVKYLECFVKSDTCVDIGTHSTSFHEILNHVPSTQHFNWYFVDIAQGFYMMFIINHTTSAYALHAKQSKYFLVIMPHKKRVITINLQLKSLIVQYTTDIDYNRKISTEVLDWRGQHSTVLKMMSVPHKVPEMDGNLSKDNKNLKEILFQKSTSFIEVRIRPSYYDCGPSSSQYSAEINHDYVPSCSQYSAEVNYASNNNNTIQKHRNNYSVNLLSSCLCLVKLFGKPMEDKMQQSIKKVLNRQAELLTKIFPYYLMKSLLETFCSSLFCSIAT